MPADGCLGLRQCFAGLDARVPRVIKLAVTHTSAVSEPRTTATATTAFPRFPDGATFGTYGTDGRRRRRACWCSLVEETNTRRLRGHTLVMRMYMPLIGLGLTFAGLHAFGPHVINIFVTNPSAVFEPSTTRRATTGSTGFLECAALWAL